jgi:hypothetical protein
MVSEYREAVIENEAVLNEVFSTGAFLLQESDACTQPESRPPPSVRTIVERNIEFRLIRRDPRGRIRRVPLGVVDKPAKAVPSDMGKITGFSGQRVILNGGALVFPVLHEIIPVNMNTLRLEVRRAHEQALITRDRMRVDVTAEFYVRVKPSEESIANAAQTLGMKTMHTEEPKELVEGKFVDALRAVATEMAMTELHEKRVDFVQKVQQVVSEDLLKNGLELESVSLTGLDQTSKEQFNPNNAFDAEGLTRLTEEIEARRKKRNDIEQDTNVAMANKDLEADGLAAAIKLRADADAIGKKAINEAANVLSAEQIAMQVKLELLKVLPQVIRESVKPMEQIDGIKIIQVDGLNGSGASIGGYANGDSTNLADQLINSALRYRGQAPLVDSMLAEIGLKPGDINGLTASLRPASDAHGEDRAPRDEPQRLQQRCVPRAPSRPQWLSEGHVCSRVLNADRLTASEPNPSSRTAIASNSKRQKPVTWARLSQEFVANERKPRDCATDC